MRVFVAGFNHETSSFSPIPTSKDSFYELEYYRPSNGQVDPSYKKLNGYRVFVEKSLQKGFEVYASTNAWAQPSGPCNTNDYESIRDEILNDLSKNGPFDMVFFFLHGAQMAEGYPDCEGDLIKRARDITGDEVFIGVELDLHANVTQKMLDHSSVILACKHYPHIDFDERAEDLFNLAELTVKGKIRPRVHFERIPMMGMFYTTEPLMTKANQLAMELEQEKDVHSVSLIHGFRWADIPEMGAGIIYITDGDYLPSNNSIREIKQAFYDAREETKNKRKSIEQVIDITDAHKDKQKPIVVADACDNAGGGAGSDSTFILKEVLDRKLKGYAFALFWDPVVAQFCKSAGIGTTLNLRLGGKTGVEAGAPIDVNAKVISINEDAYQTGIGFNARLGLTVGLEISGNYVIVNSVRGQVFSTTCFSDFIPNIENVRVFVVKSSQHFYDQFAPIAEQIVYCETPGSLSLSPDPNRYENVQRPIWPFDQITI